MQPHPLVRYRGLAVVPALLLALAVAGAAPRAQTTLDRAPDVPYVPTPEEVVDAMLKVANVTKNDIVYDLGSGDGRIVIAAAKKYGARGVGIEIDPERIREANENARKAGVEHLVRFVHGDIFTADFSEATVVTMYLLPSVNMRLRPRLLNELRPGTRIVSHSFDLGDWKPDKTLVVDGRTVYFWVVPPRRAEGPSGSR
ncbi:MAG TPA: class I SAM-dependent methyltransferase [Thermodesulfobacteriota bacterium]|nr:class I SAM-dependent methyltransferase [Thermodesulfobacteriota bacterium]